MAEQEELTLSSVITAFTQARHVEFTQWSNEAVKAGLTSEQHLKSKALFDLETERMVDLLKEMAPEEWIYRIESYQEGWLTAQRGIVTIHQGPKTGIYAREWHKGYEDFHRGGPEPKIMPGGLVFKGGITPPDGIGPLGHPPDKELYA